MFIIFQVIPEISPLGEKEDTASTSNQTSYCKQETKCDVVSCIMH